MRLLELEESGTVITSSNPSVAAIDSDDSLSISSHSTLDSYPVHCNKRFKLVAHIPFSSSQRIRTGKRSLRRQLNDSYLQSLSTVTEVTEEDISGISSSVSPLGSLFDDPVDMEKWDYFSALSEEEQLFCIKESHQAEQDAVPSPWSYIGWGRISNNCRKFLIKKAKQEADIFSRLDQIEDNLRTTFVDADKFQTDSMEGQQRLLIHAESSYLGLNSQSVSLGDNLCKPVEIINRNHPYFRPPSESLSKHLQLVSGIVN